LEIRELVESWSSDALNSWRGSGDGQTERIETGISHKRAVKGKRGSGEREGSGLSTSVPEAGGRVWL
jgi:hypothetical protein